MEDREQFIKNAKLYYENHIWTEEILKTLLSKGKISEDEYNQIVE